MPTRAFEASPNGKPGGLWTAPAEATRTANNGYRDRAVEELLHRRAVGRARARSWLCCWRMVEA
ncbi:hypothetical protein ACFWN2_42180 [Lentzea sp. NPDC058436]|uniref:hypothetical protein n=1 Tax=Lentzea sp. NPDC058436 TaxID=3346499 RepID=UPI00364754D7